MKRIDVKVFITALMFGLAACLVVFLEIFIKLPGTNLNTDIREIFVLIGSALTGPLYGMIIGFLSSILEPQVEIRFYVVIQHIFCGALVGYLYKKYIYEKFSMPYFVFAWFLLVLLYYYLFYWPIMVIVYFIFPEIYGVIIAGEEPNLFLNMLSFIKGWLPEVVITSMVTSAIWMALPPEYRKPLWGTAIEKVYKPKISRFAFLKNNKLRNTLTLRLTIVFFILALIPVLILGVFIKDDVSKTILNREGELLYELAREYTSKNTIVEPKTYYKLLKETQKTRNGNLFVVNSKGNYLIDPIKIKHGKNAYSDYPNDIINRILSQKNGYVIDIHDNMCYGFSHIKMSIHEFIIVTVSDKNTLEKVMGELQYATFAKLAGGMFLISIGLILILWLTVKKPLSKLTDVLQQFGDGNYDVYVPNEGMNDEMKIFAESFNEMAVKIKETSAKLHGELKYHEEAELALTASEKKFRTLFENLTVGFVLYEVLYNDKGEASDFRYIEMNQAYQKILGRSTSGMQGFTGKEIFGEINKRFLANLGVVAKTHTPLSFEYYSVSTNKYLDIWLFNSDDNKVAAIINDVTEKKHLNQLMIQNEKMASIAGLAAGMAHEINNPLGTVVQGCQNLIRRTSKEISKNLVAAEKTGLNIDIMQAYFRERNIDQIIESIRNAAEKASEIIKNMLQFSRKSESKKADTDIEQLIEETIELANNDYNLKKKYDFRNIQIDREYEKNIPKMWVTVTEIQQVILNILQNAAQAMKEINTKLPNIKIRVKKLEESVQIEISDNGPGMDEQTSKRVFEPFFTTKEVGEGTGLGMSVSYMIIKNNHNGNIAVESKPGIGTIFYITLPINSGNLS